MHKTNFIKREKKLQKRLSAFGFKFEKHIALDDSYKYVCTGRIVKSTENNTIWTQGIGIAEAERWTRAMFGSSL